MATTSAPAPQGQGQKRGRSWEVDVSLEELVSWDVLEQFMQEMPGGGSGDATASLSGLSQTNLGQAAVDEFAALGNSLTDPMQFRGSGVDTSAAALLGSAGLMASGRTAAACEAPPLGGGGSSATAHTSTSATKQNDVTPAT